MPRRVKKLPLTAEGSDLEQAELEQRVGEGFCVQPVAGDEREGERGEAGDLGDAEGVFAEDFEDVGEQGDAGAEEDEADDVEGMGFFAVVGKVEVDEDQADEADGDVEEEDDAPVEVVDDEAAGHGAEHGCDEGGDGDEAHGAEEIGFAEGADQGEAADGHHHGASATLQDAAGDEYMDVAGEAA